MFFFNKKRPPSRRTLKFYCVHASNREAHIDRPALVDGLIAACETYFGQPPKKFDIGGPYGIRKGQPVGIRSFRNRLAKRGHEDYYALWAREEDSFGFDCSFRRLTSTEYTFSELLFWFDWYLERSPAAARAFLRELDHAIKCVSEAPKQWGMHIVEACNG